MMYRRACLSNRYDGQRGFEVGGGEGGEGGVIPLWLMLGEDLSLGVVSDYLDVDEAA